MCKIAIAVLAFNFTACAASIGGILLDASGAPIAQARITLWNPVAAGEQNTATNESGAFSFPNLAAGQFLLRVEKSGFGSAFREFTIQENSQVQRKMFIGPAGTLLNPGAESFNSPNRIRVGGSEQSAQRIHLVQPNYPAGAKAAGIQGLVLIAAIILKDGSIGELTVISSPSDDLAAASLEAVRQWSYKPTLLNGEPVEVETTIGVTFQVTP